MHSKLEKTKNTLILPVLGFSETVTFWRLCRIVHVLDRFEPPEAPLPRPLPFEVCDP